MIGGIELVRAFFVLIGLGFIGLMVWGIWPELLFRLYPRTEGMITQVAFDELHPGSDVEADFIPRVTYCYRLGGQSFESNRYWALNRAPVTLFDAYESVRGLDYGIRISVAYNPRNPQDAAVKTSDFWAIWPIWLFMVGWTAVPALAATDDATNATRLFGQVAVALAIAAPLLAIAFSYIFVAIRSSSAKLLSDNNDILREGKSDD